MLTCRTNPIIEPCRTNIFVELAERILLSNFVELETINRTNRILTIFYDLQIVRQINLVELL